MHFNVSTFIAPYLQQFSSVVQDIFFWCCLGQLCIVYGANLASEFSKIMSELHRLKVLFGTNLVRKISFVELKKKHNKCPISIFGANNVQTIMYILDGI